MADKPQPETGREKDSGAREPRRRLLSLSIAALGIVFGDIGTSPLYAIRECFHGDYGIPVTPVNIMGVLSLIFWTLVLIVTLKYLTFILRADNHGEGGIIALTSLIRPRKLLQRQQKWLLVALGLFGACLLYGDGMITPAISVMSAIEGIKVITSRFEPYVIPLTVVILTSLFMVQPHGTGKVGAVFGPVICCWFVVLAVLGVAGIVRQPRILLAVSPWYAFDFIRHNHLHGFLVLGAVFLVATGAEALYADMGHFGRLPIRIVWLVLVLPALLLNYFGQGALLLRDPSLAANLFYALVPSWLMIPIVILATAATIIASQAVISGAFSLTRQAVQLGYFPRLRIIHTSASQIGQIYVPLINWLLMICTIGLAVGFRSSSHLAAAYGVAVTSTMLISTILFYVVAREKWHWRRLYLLPLVFFFLLMDLAFFLANIGKIMHGAWFPLVIGGLVFTVMVTWKKGRELLGTRIKSQAMDFAALQELLAREQPTRINGAAVFLSGNPDVVPMALQHNIRHNRIIHTTVVLLHVATRELPRVPNSQKVVLEKLGGGFYRLTANYGYMEEPSMPNIFSLAREQGLEIDLEQVSFFLGREKLTIGERPLMPRWQVKLFAFMSRNAFDAVDFFDIPPTQVVELGVAWEI
ncbi:MAG: potassium transporter Kup [Deltaproteobacteria bacterium]|nr:potassium transporter Kup [Deltaproteobacteria bacterium]